MPVSVTTALARKPRRTNSVAKASCSESSIFAEARVTFLLIRSLRLTTNAPDQTNSRSSNKTADAALPARWPPPRSASRSLRCSAHPRPGIPDAD
ncbi:hypothetical protein C7S18_20905 [Ahniella affigens]|uniref:Uncharacterized protein n=1 Tax=Ahniella affigens TaxID=2021234 RepID=A0A2P1PXA4_9GAMM|nr:hypothetical protein C7S18_20905 [Ahniella affigens]